MHTDQEIYFNWSCNLLVGEPIATDKYLQDNLKVITTVSLSLLKRIAYTPLIIYRGVIMKDAALKQLQPSNDFTYLSFSEDKKIAEMFADPEHDMGVELKARGGHYGYLTEYTPRLDEILFHHHFLKLFPYVEAILFYNNIDASKIHLQQEVTILQPSHPLIINNYDKTNSRNI